MQEHPKEYELELYPLEDAARGALGGPGLPADALALVLAVDVGVPAEEGAARVADHAAGELEAEGAEELAERGEEARRRARELVALGGTPREHVRQPKP